MSPLFVLALFGLLGCISEPGTSALPGEVTRFDPIASVPAIAAFAGDGAELIEIDLSYVRADGTMNFEVEGYFPRAEYDFRLPGAQAPDAPPGTPQHERLEGTRVTISRPGYRHVVSRGGGCNYEGNFWFGGMERGSSSASKDDVAITPTCSLDKLFARAQQDGVSADAVGTVTIDEDGYELTIHTDGVHRIVMDHDCRRAETDDERRDRERERDVRERERERERDAREREREERGRNGAPGGGGKKKKKKPKKKR